MSRKHSNSSWSLTLTFILVIGIGGFMGVSSSGLRVSLVGSVLVLVASLETGLILVGFLAIQHQRPMEKLETE